MKLPIFAAAVLLAGTSALAFAPASDVKQATGPAIEKPLVKEVIAAKEAKQTATWSDEMPALQQAALTSWESGGDDLDLSEQPDPNEPAVADTGEADTSYAEAPADAEAADTGEADTSIAGVGGPIETAAAETGPRPAAHNYPACHPGPGDDNCIQLYEPGVEVALASWTHPTGGLAQPGEEIRMASAEAVDENATGVGGPYEPIEASYSGDGVVESGIGETAQTEAIY